MTVRHYDDNEVMNWLKEFSTARAELRTMAKKFLIFWRLPAQIRPETIIRMFYPTHVDSFLDLNSIQFELKSERRKKVSDGNSFFHFHYRNFFHFSSHGRWNRGASAHAKWCRIARNRPQGTPKSSDVTTVDGRVTTTASGLCAASAQNLWNEKESSRDSRWIEHDRSKGHNVSHDIYLSHPSPFALMNCQVIKCRKKVSRWAIKSDCFSRFALCGDANYWHLLQKRRQKKFANEYPWLNVKSEH